MFWANLFGNVLTPGPAAIHRTDAIRAIGGFPDLDVLEDFVIGACLPLAGPVEWHDRWGRLWVIRDGSLWFRDQPVADLLEAKEQAIERIRSLDTPWHVRAALPFMARRLRRETLRSGDIRPGAGVPPAELIVRLPADVDFSLRERLTRAESLRRC